MESLRSWRPSPISLDGLLIPAIEQVIHQAPENVRRRNAFKHGTERIPDDCTEDNSTYALFARGDHEGQPVRFIAFVGPRAQ